MYFLEVMNISYFQLSELWVIAKCGLLVKCIFTGIMLCRNRLYYSHLALCCGKFVCYRWMISCLHEFNNFAPFNGIIRATLGRGHTTAGCQYKLHGSVLSGMKILNNAFACSDNSWFQKIYCFCVFCQQHKQTTCTQNVITAPIHKEIIVSICHWQLLVLHLKGFL